MNTKIGVLYLDDEKSNLIPFKNLFYNDYNIFTTTEAEEAIKILSQNIDSIHVIISDQRMPNITGTQFFQLVKEKFPAPIRILLTGYTDVEAVIDSINMAQIYRYISKPWKEEEMKRIIQDAYKQYEYKNIRHENSHILSVKLYTEGTTDIKYIEKAAIFLKKENVLKRISMHDGQGSENLKKKWNALNNVNVDILNNVKIILLYDCDVGKKDRQEGNFYECNIPKINENPIQKGIENLFPRTTIEKAKSYKSAFIDIIKKSGVRRGEPFSDEESEEINENEKMNFCNWLCEYGTKEDFQHFDKVFDLLEEVIQK